MRGGNEMKKNAKGGIIAAIRQFMRCVKRVWIILLQKMQNEASTNQINPTSKRNLCFTIGEGEWNWREQPHALLSATEARELLIQI